MKTRTYSKEKLLVHATWIKSMTKQELTDFYLEDTLCLLGESIDQLQIAGVVIHNEKCFILNNHLLFEMGVSWGTNKILMIRYHFVIDLYEACYCAIRDWSPEMDVDNENGEPLRFLALKHHNNLYCDDLHRLFLKYSMLPIKPPDPALFSAPHRLRELA